VDKTRTNAYYDIEIDHSLELPVKIKVLILTGTRGTSTETSGGKITGGRHVAFHFTYELSDFGKIEAPKIPPDAMRLLARG